METLIERLAALRDSEIIEPLRPETLALAKLHCNYQPPQEEN